MPRRSNADCSPSLSFRLTILNASISDVSFSSLCSLLSNSRFGVSEVIDTIGWPNNFDLPTSVLGKSCNRSPNGRAANLAVDGGGDGLGVVVVEVDGDGLAVVVVEIVVDGLDVVAEVVGVGLNFVKIVDGLDVQLFAVETKANVVGIDVVEVIVVALFVTSNSTVVVVVVVVARILLWK